LFRRILRLGAGLDAVNRSVGEQVSTQHGLRRGADTPSPALRQQYDPDAAVATSALPTRGPADEADDFASDRNDEFAILIAEPAIALETSTLFAGIAEAIPVRTYQSRLGAETAEEIQIRFEYRTKLDNANIHVADVNDVHRRHPLIGRSAR
jgi:hypothetical protein